MSEMPGEIWKTDADLAKERADEAERARKALVPPLATDTEKGGA